MSHNPHRRGGRKISGNPASRARNASREFADTLTRGGDVGHLGADGSCIGCGLGTDTAIAFKGEAEWLAAGLVQLGVPADQAIATIERAPADAFDVAADGDLIGKFRACAPCVKAAPPNFPAPVLAIPGATLPTIAQKVGY